MWQGAQCSLLECCLTEISRSRHLTWYSTQSHYTDTELTRFWFLALLSKCLGPSESATSTFLFLVFGRTWPGIEPATSRSQNGHSTIWASIYLNSMLDRNGLSLCSKKWQSGKSPSNPSKNYWKMKTHSVSRLVVILLNNFHQGHTFHKFIFKKILWKFIFKKKKKWL